MEIGELCEIWLRWARIQGKAMTGDAGLGRESEEIIDKKYELQNNINEWVEDAIKGNRGGDKGSPFSVGK